jgi:hypothetical protein
MLTKQNSIATEMADSSGRQRARPVSDRGCSVSLVLGLVALIY